MLLLIQVIVLIHRSTLVDFFETLIEYRNSKEFVSEALRTPRHPFIFTTKTGKRVHSRDTLSRFKTNLRKINKKIANRKS